MTTTTTRVVEFPDGRIADAMARIYAANQHLGPDGIPNPFDHRYMNGGGHFQRDSAWFEKMFTVPGVGVIVSEQGEEIVGFSLFFVDPDYFPPFASETLRYRTIPGVERIAYTYLIAVSEEHRRSGLGLEIMRLQCDSCFRRGAQVIAHEFFIAPVPNVSSTCFHRFMVENWGAAFTGHVATHTIQKPDGTPGTTVYYAHCLIPTEEGAAVKVDHLGNISLCNQ